MCPEPGREQPDARHRLRVPGVRQGAVLQRLRLRGARRRGERGARLQDHWGHRPPAARLHRDDRLQRARPPTAVRFAPDGRVFVAEKSGLIKVFDSLTDTTPTVFADLRTEGPQLLGPRPARAGARPRASRPARTSTSLYTYDAPIGGTAPRWGIAGHRRAARRRPGRRPTAASSAAGSRACRPPATRMTGTEQVLIEDWCQQYPSHSIGDLAFGADGALYVERRRRRELHRRRLRPGRLAGATRAAIRPAASGDALTPPTAEGGALRSQDLRTPPATRVSLDGTIIRVDPAPAPACPDNPLRRAPTPTRGASSPTASATRSVRASGRARTSSGSATSAGTPGRRSTASSTRPRRAVENFGWPCYEGAGPQPGYEAPA